MRRKILKKLIGIILFAVFVFSLSSCLSKEDRNEALNAIPDLIEKSYEINEIYFGRGLPCAEYLGNDDDYLKYSEIADDSPYHTIPEIKKATEEVYCATYCEMLFKKAFEGTAVEIGEGDSASQQIAEYARYVDYSGVLTVRLLNEEEIITLDRTYDTEKAEITSYGDNYVMIKVPSFKDGIADVDVELKVVKESDGWRLACPTY